MEPIKSGDHCEVISGVFGDKSPNVGKKVTVIQFSGDHSEYGRIWLCNGQNLATEYGGVGSEVQFAQAWLRKLPPETTPPVESKIEEHA